MDSKFCNGLSPYLNSAAKRCFDIIVCLILFVPAVLILLVILSIVSIIDGRPVLFFQRRIGKDGREFVMPKVRTLKKHAHPSKPACSYNIETFTTKTGTFLRRHRLDELPQIFSVLAGQMSLVGPRPELPDEVKKYSPKQLRRLSAKPGLTGLWQIRASRSQPMYKNIKYDLYYITNASLWLDIKILAQTPPFVLRKKSKNFHEDSVYTYNLSIPE